MNLSYQIIDSVLASIYWKDVNGVYLGCNRYMVQMAGFNNRDQIIGKTDFDLPWKEQAEEINKTDKIVIKNNKTYKLEENPLIHDGIRKTYLSSKTPLLDDCGKVIGVIGVSIDISDKKEIEQILELTEQHLENSLTIKERFLRNIDHETRNPLQGIVVSAELLANEWQKFADAQRYELSTMIANSARRLANLVNNTFDLSELIKNEAKLKLEKSDITDQIKLIIKSYNDSSIYSKKAQIVLNSPKHYSLVYDKQKIKQVIDNLLLNAIKWTELNEIITVELYKDFIPYTSISGVYCRVTNKGVQIPNKELKFIFEPFAESSNTAAKECGVGLGLALCKEILRTHRGEIWAENNSNIGVSFNFFIPNNLIESIEL